MHQGARRGYSISDSEPPNVGLVSIGRNTPTEPTTWIWVARHFATFGRNGISVLRSTPLGDFLGEAKVGFLSG
jgi:hypothetical protein